MKSNRKSKNSSLIEKRDVLTKLLAIFGTVLVWFPILAPIVHGIDRVMRGSEFLVDYLMPAELFPVVLVGAALLLFASFRSRLYWRLIEYSLGAALFFLVGGQVVAFATGLASGKIEAAGWQWIVVLGSMVAYALAVVVLGVSGLLLFFDLFKKPSSSK